MKRNKSDESFVSGNGLLHAGSLLLVNADCPYMAALSRENLVRVGDTDSGVLLEHRAAALLERLMSEIHGWESIVPVSGWRSFKGQQKIWTDSIKAHGKAFTEKYVAVPGHSEHQTGLAIDLGLKKKHVDFIRPEFPYTGICQVFRQKAAGFGFIQRYPAGKESVTGIAHEPWHFRFVGMPHSEIMTKMNLTLEEYLVFLKQFPYGGEPLVYKKDNHCFEITYQPVLSAGELPARADMNACQVISGNNADGYIVTKWQNGECADGFAGKNA